MKTFDLVKMWQHLRILSPAETATNIKAMCVYLDAHRTP